MMVSDALVPQYAWIRGLHNRNPFFLLSAGLMMTGCFLLNSALFESGGGVQSLLIVLVAINVYEFALIGLSALLVGREGTGSRDGRMLAAFETMFLVDGTFSLGAIATLDAGYGFGVGAGLLILGALKLAAVMAIFRLPHRRWLAVAVLLQLAVLLAAPAIFRYVGEHHGDLLPMAVYAGCWVAGAVVAAAGLMIAPLAGVLFAPNRPRAVVVLYLLVPCASVVLHVYTAIIIYPTLQFSFAHLTPLLLGLVVVVESFAPFARTTWRIRRCQAGLLAASILASVDGPAQLEFKLWLLELSPLVLALTGCAAAVLLMLWNFRLRHFCIGLAVAVLAAALWTNQQTVRVALEQAQRWLDDILSRTLPQPAIRWGVFAVVGAFIFLIVGAAFSLRRRPAGSARHVQAGEDAVIATAEPAAARGSIRDPSHGNPESPDAS